jgi:hypothetical protein
VTERDRRALIVGGGVTLAALLFLRVVPWTIRSVLAAEMHLREQTALLARARADVADAVMLRDSAAQLSQALVGLAPKILSGNTSAEAIADLSGRVNLAASSHQAKLERIDPVADSTRVGRLHRVTLRAGFASDVRGLVGVLQALAFAKAALALRELRVTAVDVASAEKNPEVLRVELTVSGWFLMSGREGTVRGDDPK